jgi:ferredoxin
VVPAEPVRLVPNLDSLSNVLAAAADSLPPSELPPLEMQIREWLGRLEFEDPALLPEGETPRRYFRLYRGRLLDALGWAAFRQQDLRQAEAALIKSAAREIAPRRRSRRSTGAAMARCVGSTIYARTSVPGSRTNVSSCWWLSRCVSRCPTSAIHDAPVRHSSPAR